MLKKATEALHTNKSLYFTETDFGSIRIEIGINFVFEAFACSHRGTFDESTQ